jgi:hypothetical protein
MAAVVVPLEADLREATGTIEEEFLDDLPRLIEHERIKGTAMILGPSSEVIFEVGHVEMRILHAAAKVMFGPVVSVVISPYHTRRRRCALKLRTT